MDKSKLLLCTLFLCLLLPAACRRAAPTPTPPPTEPPQMLIDVNATAVPPLTPLPTRSPTPEPPLVALDPGHGGADLGARHFTRDGNMDFYESAVNLDLAQRIGKALEARGLRVMYTREGDYYPNRDQVDLNGDGVFDDRDDLNYRNHLMNEAGADLMLCLHENGWEAADEELVRATGGTTTYYCPDRPFADDSLRFANLVHEAVLATLSRFGHEPTDRGIVPDVELVDATSDGQHLIVLGPEDDIIQEATQMPGSLSEPMFITCDAEAELMLRDDFMDALAEAYADAIEAYFEEQGTP